MSSADERSARSLAIIASNLGGLVKVMTTMNENLVAFTKQIQESDDKYDKLMQEKGDMLALIPRGTPPPEPCTGCGLLYCEMEDCGTKKEGE